MPNWRDPSNELKDLLVGVSSVGVVFDYPPELREEFDYKDLATSWDDDTNKPIINVWIIERTSITDKRGGRAADVCLTRGAREDAYRIMGFYGFGKDGKTYFEFQAVVEDVLDALMDAVTLGGHSGWVAFAAIARNLDFRRFGPYLCHWAEITVTVHRRLTPTFA